MGLVEKQFIVRNISPPVDGLLAVQMTDELSSVTVSPRNSMAGNSAKSSLEFSIIKIPEI
jgi:hypothetical protein